MMLSNLDWLAYEIGIERMKNETDEHLKDRILERLKNRDIQLRYTPDDFEALP